MYTVYDILTAKVKGYKEKKTCDYNDDPTVDIDDEETVTKFVESNVSFSGTVDSPYTHSYRSINEQVKPRVKHVQMMQ